MAHRRDFRGKAVVVTGAASGIGLALARRFGQAGSTMAMLDINKDALTEASSRLANMGIRTMHVECDVSDPHCVAGAMEEVIKDLGGVDVLINNAGISARAAFAATRLEVFHRVMGVNFFGALYCTKACLESLLERKGLVITISSLAGFSPLLGRSAYSASKHALHGLFDTLRSEFRRTGLDFLIVCPGFTATAIGISALDGDGAITRHPQSTAGRPSKPEHVADQIFRAAEKNRKLLILSRIGHLGRFINKISPSLYEYLMIKSMRSELER
ncbi:MAG: SDR family oxidoreductase [Desulfobacteraceae bacterium]|jgi:NAD(P)-dependent dehydrogenase (short-subunit alcohol dehydrogenase family)|nr:MAG: SDR family oxidoreductase [Desulfobacteraceae bacterium]